LHNDELCSLYPSPKYYCDQLKESEIGWHPVCVGEMRNSYKILKRKQGESLGISRRIILKEILQEIGSEDAGRIH